MGGSTTERGVSQSDLGTVGLRRQKQDLDRTIQNVRIEGRRIGAEATRAFKEKYGPNLATFSLIYSDLDLHKDGSVQYHYGNAPFYVDEASGAYANALVEALDKQPEMDKSKWLKEFFGDLSSVLQFQLPPNP